MINYIINGKTHISTPDTEQKVKRELIKLYSPSDIVTVMEWNGRVIDTDRLENIFDYGKAG